MPVELFLEKKKNKPNFEANKKAKVITEIARRMKTEKAMIITLKKKKNNLYCILRTSKYTTYLKPDPLIRSFNYIKSLRKKYKRQIKKEKFSAGFGMSYRNTWDYFKFGFNAALIKLKLKQELAQMSSLPLRKKKISISF